MPLVLPTLSRVLLHQKRRTRSVHYIRPSQNMVSGQRSRGTGQQPFWSTLSCPENNFICIRNRVPNTSERSSQTFSKNTPHLTAILTRAATRTRKALPSKFSAPSPVPALPPTAEYRPSSIPAFLSRLSTFKLATYANKPPAIDAVAASKCGWINDGKDRLVCGLCTSSWVVAGREGMNRDAGEQFILSKFVKFKFAPSERAH